MDKIFRTKSTNSSIATSLATFAADSSYGLNIRYPSVPEIKQTRESLDDLKTEGILKPFELTWTFGFTPSIPVINLTYGNRHDIFYVAANVGILYNYCKKIMFHLKGHRNKIISAAIDRSGRWLATAENGREENLILIWDSVEKQLIWTIFNQPAPPHKIILLAFSPNAKLLVTVTNKETMSIDFWLWTYGNKEPDDSYTFDEDNFPGLPKSIEFHPNKEEHCMIIFENQVLFFGWDNENNKMYKPTMPAVYAKGLGHYTNGTYVEHCHECFVSTVKGAIIVFGNTIYSKPFGDKFDNKKMYIKNITISNHSVTCITSVDGIIITADATGRILFFDKWLKLLYWFGRSQTRPIISMSFKLAPRAYRIENYYDETNSTESIIPDCERRAEEYEVIFKEQVPLDASLRRFPFITRDFFISTDDGNIYAVNFLKKEFVPIFSTSDSHIAAIDIHDELPHMIVAYKSGRLTVFNYETHEEVISTIIPAHTGVDAESAKATISAIKYSKQGLHLACGKSNGELWMLQSAALSQIYVSPFRYGTKKIISIIFSVNSLQMAYYDEGMTVFGFSYDTELEDWVFKGKVRSHYKEISNLLFLNEAPYSLYSVGKDRHIIKYTELGVSDDELDCVIRDRVEQRDIPLYFIHYPNEMFSQCEYFLIADDKHKFKKVSAKTHVTTSVYLGPAYGCFRDSPVRKMEFIPMTNQKYLIMMNNKHIGIQVMPIDGNPYKFIGSQVHPVELLDFQIGRDGKHVFTVGKYDRCVFKWRIKTSAVHSMQKYGGEELQPFYCLIDGGRNGYQFQEMRDLFYYMQILQQGENISLPRVVTNSINIVELPDLVRACGYFPSEYEIENLLIDARYKEYDRTCVTKDQITFCEFVKLFINHKPSHGYLLSKLQDAFDNVAEFCEHCYPGQMEREYFVEAICTSGENVSQEQIYKCFSTLLRLDREEDNEGADRDFSFLPVSIDFDTFIDDILGIDLDAHSKADVERKEILEENVDEEEEEDLHVCT